jgi:hypothetical protein
MDTTSRLPSTDSYFTWKPTHNNTGNNIFNWFNLVIFIIKHLIYLAFYYESICLYFICLCHPSSIFVHCRQLPFSQRSSTGILAKELCYFSCVTILWHLLYSCVIAQFIMNNQNSCFAGITEYNNRLWVGWLGFNCTKSRFFSLYCCVH